MTRRSRQRRSKWRLASCFRFFLPVCAVLLTVVAASGTEAAASDPNYGSPLALSATSTTPTANVAVAMVAREIDRAGLARLSVASIPSLVATEDAGDTLLHYTTADRAEQIIGDGEINPSADGNTYLTPDRYADGSTAQSRLAMGTEPEGYIEVPRPAGAPEPTGVDPFNGQPGGGLEVRVPGPVSVPPGSVFHPF
jgi:hypothetical protein